MNIVEIFDTLFHLSLSPKGMHAPNVGDGVDHQELMFWRRLIYHLRLVNYEILRVCT